MLVEFFLFADWDLQIFKFLPSLVRRRVDDVCLHPVGILYEGLLDEVLLSDDLIILLVPLLCLLQSYGAEKHLEKEELEDGQDGADRKQYKKLLIIHVAAFGTALIYDLN